MKLRRTDLILALFMFVAAAFYALHVVKWSQRGFAVRGVGQSHELVMLGGM